MNAIPIAVRDYMSTSPVTVTPGTEITQVVHVLIERDISGVIVIDSANAVVGVVTERDCIAAASSADYYGEWGGPVEKFMSSPVECVNPHENLVDVAAIVFVRGKRPAEDVVELANKAGIGIFVTDMDTWSFAMKLNEIGVK